MVSRAGFFRNGNAPLLEHVVFPLPGHVVFEPVKSKAERACSRRNVRRRKSLTKSVALVPPPSPHGRPGPTISRITKITHFGVPARFGFPRSFEHLA